MQPSPRKNVLRMKLRSLDVRLLDFVVRKITEVCQNAAVKCTVIALPRKERFFTVLKAPFVDTVARDQFVYTSYSRLLELHLKAGQFSELFKDFKVPNGIDVEVKTKNN